MKKMYVAFKVIKRGKLLDMQWKRHETYEQAEQEILETNKLAY